MKRLNYTSAPIISLLTICLTILASATPAMAKAAKCPHVEKVTIKAPPSIVYNTILNLRKSYPENVKELSRTSEHCLVEETFHVLPVIGKTKCVYKETYKPHKEVSYKMVESPRFKAFEGRWTLTPVNGGKHTNLALSSYIDPGINLPFAKQITKIETKKGIKKRLTAVKKKSEKRQLAMSNNQRTQ